MAEEKREAEEQERQEQEQMVTMAAALRINNSSPGEWSHLPCREATPTRHQSTNQIAGVVGATQLATEQDRMYPLQHHYLTAVSTNNVKAMMTLLLIAPLCFFMQLDVKMKILLFASSLLQCRA